MDGKGHTLFPNAVMRSCDEDIVYFNMSSRVAGVLRLLCPSVEDGITHSAEP